MKRILNIFKNYSLKTGILIFVSILMNKLIGKYFFFFIKTQKLLSSNIVFTEFKHNIIQLQYKNFCINCRKFSSDINVFIQIFIDNEFEKLNEIVINQSININTIIDLGANIGISSLWFKLMFNNSELFTVEPDIDNFKILKNNLEINNINATNINKGIWKDSRKLYIDRSFRDKQSWSITLTENVNSSNFIYSISIDDLIEQYKISRIDLLKIDIEGAERMVFIDNEEGLKFLKITKILVLEIHKEFDIRKNIIEVLLINHFNFFESGEYFIGINQTI